MSRLFSSLRHLVGRPCLPDPDIEQGIPRPRVRRRLLALVSEPSPKILRVDQLPNDVLVDQVLSYLDLPDLLALRRVSVLFYELTHHTVIWKRLLRRTDVVIPPIPPTARYTLPHLTGLDLERLLLRAISVERRWSDPSFNEIQPWTFNAHHRICSMVALPGGPYLIASVCDHGSNHYSLVVFVTDYSRGGVIPLAKTRTKTKAYHLQARYLTVNGKRSIVIAYVRKEYKNHKERRRPHLGPHDIDISDYAGDYEVEHSVAVKHECTVLQISLEKLEHLSDPRLHSETDRFLNYAIAQEAPFRLLAVIKSRRQLMHPVLDEIRGSPFIAVVKLPNTIVFKNLEGGALATMDCAATTGFPNNEHTILAIRLIPVQDTILVVRKLRTPPLEPSTEREKRRGPQDLLTPFIEYYAIPPIGEKPLVSTSVSTAQIQLESCYALDDVTISDHGIPTRFDDSIKPVLWSSADAYAPSPIHIFMRCYPPEAYMRLTIYPERIPNVRPPTPPTTDASPKDLAQSAFEHSFQTYHYPISHEGLYGEKLPPQHPAAELRILPGSARAILYSVYSDTVTLGHRVHIMERYSLPRAQTEEKDRKDVCMRFPRWPGMKSIQTMAWDDTIGRLFVAEKDTSMISVLDFGAAPRLDDDGKRMPLPVHLSPHPDDMLTPMPEVPPQEDHDMTFLSQSNRTIWEERLGLDFPENGDDEMPPDYSFPDDDDLPGYDE
ncbi:uncharacterized protein FIBRA_01071 [Fibroporia radiculosa]|uniref:F-box domain-containing protein n=1 Tax=Fibroporia radiculosa TaxID=599839 RepID=J4GJ89_9APHY|nr:uncharacterized protein FIBRA_01071 [Fibroporia radiculosa]CCL99060.1 predicted protein [Fibroporia radiculosa]